MNQNSQQFEANFNQTRMIINNLALDKVRSLRTMHIVLGGFSLALLTLTFLRILNDARKAAKLQVVLRPKRFAFVDCIHPAELFPLIFSGSILVQVIVFIAVQSNALNSILVRGCDRTAQIIFPALYLPAFTLLIFGVETVVRSFKRERFGPRGKWNTKICLLLIALATLAIWVPTTVNKTRRFCFGSIVWFVIPYYTISIALIPFLLFSFLLLAGIIAVQLLRSMKVDPNERIAASWMIFYFFTGVVVYVLVLPFYLQAKMHGFDDNLTTTRVAEISLFTYGLAIAFIHLFMRVNASRMVIKPLGTPWKKSRGIRFFGPADLELNISGPLGLMSNNDREEHVGSLEKDANTNDLETRGYVHEKQGVPSRSVTPVDPSRWPLPPDPAQTPRASMARSHKRAKSSYSLFPTRAEDVPRLPATVYSPPKRSNTRATQASIPHSVTDVREMAQHLDPPIFPNSHRRDASSDSSATVQIGLRFSVAPASIAAADCSTLKRALNPATPLPLPNRRLLPPALLSRESSESSLGLPIQRPSSPAGSPNPSPVEQSSHNPTSPQLLSRITPQNCSNYLKNARNKVLPPTPRVSNPPTFPAPLRMNPPTVVSSPVRTPVTTTPSPRRTGPGIGQATMGTSSGMRSPLRSPLRSPPAKRPDGPGWI
ncbi:hypothetical protein M501DRAFT_931612 [Patellaria atrata CBS 101060]|uniref:Uncharacterized protein n=1 Tax=Patellaria atrata CBS 101060 TaxID=1346257 RepID=A0A9P4SCV6_9PEZI|nr:hypothetical protein M501DRAFT_931612 [Patellaria atrata CBS 101060]